MSPSLDTPAAPRGLQPTRPFYWSVRRELWENRSTYLAPLIVAGVVLFAYLLGMAHLATGHATWTHDGEAQQMDMAALLTMNFPYHVVAAAVLITGLIVGMFYCLGALHGERQDRSILFWKSLPVSDRVAVLAKTAIPMLVIPAAAIVIALAAQLVMVLISLIGLAAHGKDPGMLWSTLPFAGVAILVYGQIAVALWYAPVYAWFLLVSAWAKKMTFLWAVAPPLVLALFEKIAFHTSFVGELVKDRLFGVSDAAFRHIKGHEMELNSIDPGGYLASPGLWLGLIAAGLMLAGVVWLRRRREPI